MTMARFYTKSLHHHFKNYYATWLPGIPLELGDYGELDDKVFTKIGNITGDFGIQIQSNYDPTSDVYEYTSSGLVKVKLLGGGGANVGTVGKAEAKVKVSFSSENAVFFYLDKCKCNSVQNIKAVREGLLNSKDWNIKHYVITEIIEAGATTILISGGNSAEIIFGVKGKDVSVANFVNAGMRLSVKSQDNIGLKVIAGKGLKPLFRLRKLHEPHFFDQNKDFKVEEKAWAMSEKPDLRVKD